MDKPVQLDLHEALLAALEQRLSHEPFWREKVRTCFETQSPHSLHLAIFRAPYLDLILAGKKTIESRFSVNRIAPYEVAEHDDLVLLKRSPGPITALCLQAKPIYNHLDPESSREIPRRL